MKNKIEIEIKEYKAISNVKISLNTKTKNRLISIIGDNNSGKSSVLEAINKMGNKNPNIKNNEITTYWDSTEKTISKSKSLPFINIKFNFLYNKEDIHLEFSTKNNEYRNVNFTSEWIKEREENIRREVDKLRNDNVFKKSNSFINFPGTFENEKWFHALCMNLSMHENESKKSLKKTNEIKELMNYKYMENNINIYNIDTINIFKYRSLSLDLMFHQDDVDPEKAEKFRIIKIWEKILKLDFKNFAIKTAKTKEKTNKKSLISKFDKDANEFIKKLSEKIFNESPKEILEISYDSEDSTLNINWRNTENRKNKIVMNEEINQTGDGIKNFWSIIFRIQSIHKNTPSLILVDEPEKFLNPMQQNSLLKYFRHITSLENERLNQVIIYTTHSPFMIDMNIYQNIFELNRSEENNGINVSKIYETKNRKTPNLLLDKNNQLRFSESLHLKNRFDSVIFVEGISDYNVMRNIISDKDNWIIIPLFGEEYKKTISFHLPYFMSYIDLNNIKFLLDGDDAGKKICEWIKSNTTVMLKNIKKYDDFFDGKTLEDAIINPWFETNSKFEKTKDKKINSLIFNENNLNKINYKNILDFINSKKI